MIPLVLGMLLITTLLVTVVTDVGSMWLARRSLQATVDGAALAGSRAVDLAASTLHRCHQMPWIGLGGWGQVCTDNAVEEGGQTQ